MEIYIVCIIHILIPIYDMSISTYPVYYTIQI